jgi:hypothetical protein
MFVLKSKSIYFGSNWIFILFDNKSILTIIIWNFFSKTNLALHFTWILYTKNLGFAQKKWNKSEIVRIIVRY